MSDAKAAVEIARMIVGIVGIILAGELISRIVRGVWSVWVRSQDRRESRVWVSRVAGK